MEARLAESKGAYSSTGDPDFDRMVREELQMSLPPHLDMHPADLCSVHFLQEPRASYPELGLKMPRGRPTSSYEKHRKWSPKKGKCPSPGQDVAVPKPWEAGMAPKGLDLSSNIGGSPE